MGPMIRTTEVRKYGKAEIVANWVGADGVLARPIAY
jgi:hypothetical protein